MLKRRHFLNSTVGALALAASASVFAQSWKERYPELVFAIIPAENAAGVSERWAPFAAYMSKQLGTKVTVRVAQDYAAIIEGQKAGQIHIAAYGPASFARARMTGARIEAFAQDVNLDGSKGYHAVLYVRKDNPATRIQDLKGKNLCLVDPNSTSGNNVPRFAMHKLDIDPDTFFSRVVYAGSHENAVIAVQQGTCDGAFNWWNDEQESNLMRMERKGMAKYADFKIIFKSDQIINSPMAYLADLPADLKRAIQRSVLDLAKHDRAAFDKITDGKARPWEAVDSSAYDPIIELNKFVDNLRKKRAG